LFIGNIGCPPTIVYNTGPKKARPFNNTRIPFWSLRLIKHLWQNTSKKVATATLQTSQQIMSKVNAPKNFIS